MSKVFENKQIIHIATEIVILIGLTVYLNFKNKRLQSQIDDLLHRLEDQEDLIQKHEKIIMQLVHAVNSYNSSKNLNNETKNKEKDKLSEKIHEQSEQSEKSPKHKKGVIRRPRKPSPINKTKFRGNMLFNDNEEINENLNTHFKLQPERLQPKVNQSAHISECSSENESALDAELAEELHELQQEEDGLKKEP